jgi:hypothetical protein
MSLRTALEKALAAMMKMSLPCVGTFPTKERRENIWAQIAVSICVLLLPPVLAFAVLAPHPPGSVSGDILGATEPVAESPSTSVPTTEGSLWPPSRPRQLPGTDLQFEDRFAAAFSHADDIDGQPPAVREELSVQPPQIAAPSHRVLSAADVRFHHRNFRHGESHDLSARNVPRSSGQRHSQSLRDHFKRSGSQPRTATCQGGSCRPS